MSSTHFHLLRVIAGFSLLAAASLAHAEVTTQGTPEVVHLDVKNASIADVLDALRDAYGLAYRSNIPLERQVSGTYEGPLPQVVTRLLEGNNFVLTHSGNSFQVVILSSGASQAVPNALSAIPFPIPTGKAVATQMPPGLVLPPPGPTSPSAR